MEATTPSAPPAATPAAPAVPTAPEAPKPQGVTAAGVLGLKPDAKPEATKPEEPKAEAKPDEKKPDPTGARFAELARKEKALTQQRMRMAEERKAFEAERAEAAEVKAMADNFTRNPGAWLKHRLGDDWFGKLSKLYTDGVPPAELALQAVDERLSAFEKQQKAAAEAQAKAAQEAKEAEEKQTRERFTQECQSFVQSHPDDYEQTIADGEFWMVPRLIEEQYNASGKLLTSKEAADAVESFLVERAKKRAATKKVQAALQPPAKRTPAATLSNDMTAQSPVARPPPRSDDERFARAMAAMEEASKRRG